MCVHCRNVANTMRSSIVLRRAIQVDYLVKIEVVKQASCEVQNRLHNEVTKVTL